MNERIKEIIKESGAEELGADLYGGEFIGAIRSDFLEKFAELIIKECIDVLNPDNDLTSMREEYGRKLSMRLIEQHFGVEDNGP